MPQRWLAGVGVRTYMISVCIFDTFEHIVFELSDDRGLLFRENVFNSLHVGPTLALVESQQSSLLPSARLCTRTYGETMP